MTILLLCLCHLAFPLHLIGQDNAAWEGCQEVSSGTCCSKQGHQWGQSGLLRILKESLERLPRMENADPLWATCATAGVSWA